MLNLKRSATNSSIRTPSTLIPAITSPSLRPPSPPCRTATPRGSGTLGKLTFNMKWEMGVLKNLPSVLPLQAGLPIMVPPGNGLNLFSGSWHHLARDPLAGTPACSIGIFIRCGKPQGLMPTCPNFGDDLRYLIKLLEFSSFPVGV